MKNYNKARDIILNTPFFIPRKVFGIRNDSKSFDYQRMTVIKDLQRYAGLPQIDLPLITRIHYRPQDKDSIPHEFDYEKSEFFRIDGKYNDLVNKSESDIKEDLGIEGGNNSDEEISNHSEPGDDVTI
jgi:hypothetical protein